MKFFILLTGLLSTACVAAPAATSSVPPGFVLHYLQDFSSEKSRADFAFTDGPRWSTGGVTVASGARSPRAGRGGMHPAGRGGLKVAGAAG